jgi:xanthine dehydrogenase accessory factor
VIDALAWIGALPAALRAEGRAVLVITANTRGSTPRESGATMLVGRNTVHGTIGGGHLEFEATRIARDALGEPDTRGTWMVRFPLAATLGQCCGGVANVVFAIVDAGRAAWIETAQAHVRRALPFALVHRIGPEGGTCCVVDSSMIKLDRGDSEVPEAAIAAARHRLDAGAADAVVLDVADDVTTLLHVVRPHRCAVLVFGNGHVGRALVHILGALPVHVRWIDEREGDFPSASPANVEVVVTDAPEDEIDHAPPDAFIVVTTHSHALDYALVECALRRGAFSYLGLIGSNAKRAQFERRWRARGGDPAALARLTCPIGKGATVLRGKEPGVIALGVAAEMLTLREAAQLHQDGAQRSRHGARCS